jgi:hypothetical protein
MGFRFEKEKTIGAADKNKSESGETTHDEGVK